MFNHETTRHEGHEDRSKPQLLSGNKWSNKMNEEAESSVGASPCITKFRLFSLWPSCLRGCQVVGLPGSARARFSVPPW